MAKRKPTEPRLWVALVSSRNKRTGRISYSAVLSEYAHKTKRAGENDILFTIEKEYPPDKYSVRIESIGWFSWDDITISFSDFIDFGDDDDDSGGSDNDDPQIDPAPEDHGVPEQFIDLIESLDFDVPESA